MVSSSYNICKDYGVMWSNIWLTWVRDTMLRWAIYTSCQGVCRSNYTTNELWEGYGARRVVFTRYRKSQLSDCVLLFPAWRSLHCWIPCLCNGIISKQSWLEFVIGPPVGIFQSASRRPGTIRHGSCFFHSSILNSLSCSLNQKITASNQMEFYSVLSPAVFNLFVNWL